MKTLQYLFDNDYENVAIYLDDKVVVDYDDYVNLETATHLLKALDIEFELLIYYFSSDEIEDWDGFPADLTALMEHLTLDENSHTYV